jgi:hypothetical protein
MRISFSTVAGGGAHGKADGIVHTIIVQAGAIMVMFPPFTGMCRPVGGMTIAGTVGKDVNGNTNPYTMSRLKRIGTTGKRTNIGRNKIIGVSMT